jgi:uncharacterized SAM-binding protein YcdF (DUF218 family)
MMPPNSEVPPSIDADARLIWDYMHMHDELHPVDAIFVLCSMDKRVAQRAANLYLEGYADRVIVSGGAGKLTKDRFTRPEAHVFADILRYDGVPDDHIIIEDQSTNTGENVRFTHAMLEELEADFKSFILVQKPYTERRAYATFKKQWPDTDTKIVVTSPQIDYHDYFTPELPKDFVINLLVGDVQRMREYAKLDYQIEQEVPDNVWQAYERLVAAGYTEQLLEFAE